MMEETTIKSKRNKPRRGRGEGAIFEIPSKGLWAAQVTVGKDDKGKRRYKTVYGKTKKDVLKKLSELQHLVLTDALPDDNRMTIANLLTNHLENYVKAELKPSTYIAHEGICRLHINPYIGGFKLSKLNASQVEGMLNTLAKKGASDRTRQYAYDVLSSALNRAVGRGWVRTNVAALVARPRVKTKFKHSPLSDKQAKALIEASRDDRYHALYVLAIHTGLRIGELLALQWPCVDLNMGYVTVMHTLRDVRGKLELGDPKSKSSNRTLPLSKVAIEALKAHRQQMLEAGLDTEWVFCDSQGGPVRRNNFHRRHFKPMLTEAKLPDIRIHDLRHTTASLALKGKVHPKVVQDLLGHSTIGVTMNTYSHITSDVRESAAEEIAAMLA